MPYSTDDLRGIRAAATSIVSKRSARSVRAKVNLFMEVLLICASGSEGTISIPFTFTELEDRIRERNRNKKFRSQLVVAQRRSIRKYLRELAEDGLTSLAPLCLIVPSFKPKAQAQGQPEAARIVTGESLAITSPLPPSAPPKAPESIVVGPERFGGTMWHRGLAPYFAWVDSVCPVTRSKVDDFLAAWKHHINPLDVEAWTEQVKARRRKIEKYGEARKIPLVDLLLPGPCRAGSKTAPLIIGIYKEDTQKAPRPRTAADDELDATLSSILASLRV